MPNDDHTKATIRNVTTGAVVECYFNPKEYSFKKTNGWTPGKSNVGSTMTPPKFTGGQPITLDMELFFDSYEDKGDKDVRTKTNGLWELMKTTETKKDGDTKLSEPPHVEFRWGEFWSFKAVITSIQQKFTLFLRDGTPVRSTVQISFLQAEETGKYPGQNPTSGGREGYAVHIVKEGESIDWIAFAQYGSSNAWRHLATANGLDEPDRLRPGQRLLIVPLGD
ncbi:MAG TPA: LysM peptidoglycan-binding domain-containing protein [Chloroflexia bacterium]|nr:LysM peptidoglycan-binding domain-containing protein [Chloroflexia bacterium]